MSPFFPLLLEILNRFRSPMYFFEYMGYHTPRDLNEFTLERMDCLVGIRMTLMLREKVEVLTTNPFKLLPGGRGDKSQKSNGIVGWHMSKC